MWGGRPRPPLLILILVLEIHFKSGGRGRPPYTVFSAGYFAWG